MLGIKRKNNLNDRRPSYRESTSSRVYSYQDLTKKRAHNTPSGSTKHKLTVGSFVNKTFKVLVILSAFGLVGLLIYASSDPILRIDSSQVTIHEQKTYVDGAKSSIKSNLFNRSKLTFDYLGFANKLQNEYPEISSVSTSFALVGTRPVVRLEFHKPALLVTSLGKTWVVDDRGVAIAKDQGRFGDLPKLEDEIGVAVEEGEPIVSSGDVNFILQIQNIAKDRGIVIDKFTTPLIPKQLNVRVVGESYYIKFNLNDESAGQIGAWLIARENLSKISQVPMEYLDVRTTEKVFWK